MYDVVRKLDKLGTAEREKVLANFEDMHMLIEDIATRIDQFNRECLSEWSPEKKAIDNAHIDMRAKYEETMDFIGKAAPVLCQVKSVVRS